MNLADSSNNFLDLWQDELLCDVQLRTVDGAIVPAHRIVLAAHSGFFRALFVGSGRQMREGVEDSKPICLTGVDEASLRALLKALYSNPIATADNLNNDTVLPLLAAASYLSVESVRDACNQYLHRFLSLETVVETLVLAERYDCADLLGDAMRYLQAHLVPLMQSSTAPSIQLLHLSLLEKLLSSDELEVSGEFDVVQAVALWVLGNVEERLQQVESLLRLVRCRLDLNDAAAAVDSAASIIQIAAASSSATDSSQQNCTTPCSPDTISRVSEAFITAVYNQNRNTTSTGSFYTGPARQGSPTQLMALGGVDEGWRSLKTVELYDPRKDEWKLGPSMPSPCSFATACTLGTNAFAIEGSAHLSVAQVYDRKKQRWEFLSKPCTARVNMAAAALPSCGVFVLGGRVGTGRAGISQRSVDRYNPETDLWDEVAYMNAPRTSLAACTVNSQHIIAVGGQSDRATHDSAELFDPGRNEWFTLDAKLEFPRKYLSAVAVGGQVIAIGGMTAARQRLASVEAMDLREGKWRSLPSLGVPRSSCGVAVLHGEVFVAGGSVGEGAAYDGVECYSITAGKCRGCAPLALGRSGLAMTPV